MTNQLRRRLRAAPPPRRVGEPNVLSNQATPNQLSTMGTAGRPGSSAPAANAIAARPAARPSVARPAVTTGRPAPAPVADDEPPRRRRLPSLGTLITVGFLIFWAARFIGGSGSGATAPTTAPRPPTAGPQATVPPGPVGVVTFGTGIGDECALEGADKVFAAHVDVWWRAELEAVQPADADALVVTFKDDTQIGREFVPAEPASGEWSILCAGEPTMDRSAGTYRVEVWDGRRTVLLASGTFDRKP